MMIPKRTISAIGLLILSAGLATAAPARVATDLNVRSGQGTGFPVVGVMPAGAVVDVRGCGDGWCYVSEYGGYASASYLDRARAAYVAPPPAIVVPAPVYRTPAYSVRPAIREFRRDVRRDWRQDRRQDVRQDRREARQDMRQERRENRREVRQDRREDRAEARQDRRQERRQDRRN